MTSAARFSPNEGGVIARPVTVWTHFPPSAMAPRVQSPPNHLRSLSHISSPHMPREHLEVALRLLRVARRRVEPRGPVHHAPLVRKLVETELAFHGPTTAPAFAAEHQDGVKVVVDGVAERCPALQTSCSSYLP